MWLSMHTCLKVQIQLSSVVLRKSVEYGFDQKKVVDEIFSQELYSFCAYLLTFRKILTSLQKSF